MSILDRLAARTAVTAAMLSLALTGTALAQSSPSGSPQGGPPRGDGAPPAQAPQPQQEAPAPQVQPQPQGQPPVSTPPAGPPACTIKGTKRADQLRGTAGDDVICGLGGNDRIKGLGGNDVIRGGAGKDRLDGGAGNDTLEGGAGKDRMNGGPGMDKARTGRGDKVTGVETTERAGGNIAKAASGYYDLGPAKCFQQQSNIFLVQTPPAATADTAQWMEHWNVVTYWDGYQWAVDANSWVGPFYSHTDYPGWFFHQSTGWLHVSQGGGESTTQLGLGGYYAPAQWLYFYGEDATVFEFTPVSAEYYGVPMNEGAGYCST